MYEFTVKHSKDEKLLKDGGRNLLEELKTE